MISFLLLISICLGASNYFCKIPIVSVNNLDNCASFIEIDDSLITNSVESSKCLTAKESSTKVTKVNEGTEIEPVYHYYLFKFETTDCTLKDGQTNSPIEVAFSTSVNVANLNVVGTVTYTIPDAESAKEYFIEGCYPYSSGTQKYYNYIVSQFGISFHLYNEEKCSGNDKVTEIITKNSYNENQAEITTIDVGNNVFSLEGDENNLRIGLLLTKSEDIPTKPQTIYEMTTSTEGKVLELNSEFNFYEVTKKKLNLIDQKSVVAKGSTPTTYKLESDYETTTYFFNKCYKKKSFTIIGNVFAEIIYSEEDCSEIDSILASDLNKKITIGVITYIVDFKAIESTGIRYTEFLGLGYAEYNLGKCLRTEETKSEQFLIDLNNKMYSVSYSTADCTTISKITLEKTVDKKPFEGKKTASIIVSYKCSITELENSVKFALYTLNECSEKIKFVVENNAFIQYTYKNLEECKSGAKGTMESKYDCNSCLKNQQYLSCPSDPVVEESSSSNKPNNEDESSSSISFMIATIAIITFFIF